jgi:hypothetical protein
VGQGVVRANFLNEFTIAGSTRIGYNDEVEWTLLASMSLETDFNSHKK